MYKQTVIKKIDLNYKKERKIITESTADVRIYCLRIT